jgi:hypothetical protein
MKFVDYFDVIDCVWLARSRQNKQNFNDQVEVLNDEVKLYKLEWHYCILSATAQRDFYILWPTFVHPEQRKCHITQKHSAFIEWIEGILLYQWQKCWIQDPVLSDLDNKQQVFREFRHQHILHKVLVIVKRLKLTKQKKITEYSHQHLKQKKWK